MTQPAAQIVAFPYQVQDDIPISELSEAEAVWVGRQEAAWLLNQLATGQIESIPEPVKQCIRDLKSYCEKHGYPPFDCDL